MAFQTEICNNKKCTLSQHFKSHNLPTSIMVYYKGQPLLEKAGAWTDFSYVPGHSDKFQIYRWAGKRINIKKPLGVENNSISGLGLNLNISFGFRLHKQTNNNVWSQVTGTCQLNDQPSFKSSRCTCFRPKGHKIIRAAGTGFMQ